MDQAIRCRRPLVAANWKMHGRREMALSFMAELLEGLTRNPMDEEMDLLICPPFVLLSELASFINSPQAAKLQQTLVLGAQNLHERPHGAYTGEISGSMLIEAGCQYVLVGHSERRTLFGENDALVAEKFIAAQQAGLTPILCLGELASERETDRTAEVVSRQLNEVLQTAGTKAFENAVVAYEPVWAIGTGLTATPMLAQEVHAQIRAELAAAGVANAAQDVRILYGGSVKPNNAADLFAEIDIDGALVGGASLEAKDFLAICAAARH